MTRRPSRAGRSRDGLFWTPTGQAEIQDNPLLRPCPACKAAPRQACTSPSRRRGGRRDLKTVHDSRRTHPSPTETHQEQPDDQQE